MPKASGKGQLTPTDSIFKVRMRKAATVSSKSPGHAVGAALMTAKF